MIWVVLAQKEAPKLTQNAMQVYWVKTGSPEELDSNERAGWTCCLEVIQSDRWLMQIVQEAELCSSLKTPWSYFVWEKLFESAMVVVEARLVLWLLQLRPEM
jgi:hypothetical protein